MPRDYKLYLEDILDAVPSVENYTGSISFDDFLSNRMQIDAVLFNLQIIGEAAARIPDEIKEQFPSIEWR